MPHRRHLFALALLATLLTSCSRDVKVGPIDAVFLIVVDTLRADHLSCHGYEGHETPHMDALAARGARFANAQAVASWTIPSMGSLLTSRYPGQLGLIERPEELRVAWQRRQQHVDNIPLYETTLAEVLSDAGFTTAAFVNQPGLNTGQGFMQGFGEWYFPEQPGEIAHHDPREKLQPLPWGPYLEEAAASDAALVATLDGWLGEHRDEKLFVWLHLLTPHKPYNPIAGFEPADSADDLAKYDAEIRSVDAMIGDLMASIDSWVGLDRSLVVFTSDHGEAFGEHGTREHGQSLHREVVHVPLVVAAPGISSREIDAYVRLLDIMPTILDAVGVPHEVDDLQGASLLPLMAGRGDDRTVFTEGMLYGETERSLIRDGRKLLYHAPADSFLLYDVVGDPDESIDLAETETRRALLMLDDLEETHRLLADDRAGRRAAAAPGDTLVSPEERARVKRALESLGY